MSLEEKKAIIRRYFEALNKQDLSSIEDFVASDYFDNTHQLRGLIYVKQFMTSVYKSFPDWHRTIEDIIAEGDKVWVRATDTYTHKGEFRGIAPTGNKITSRTVDIWRIVNGKMAESWNVTDTLDFLTQLVLSNTTDFLTKLSNSFDLQFSNPYAYRMSSEGDDCLILWL